ncbi:condensation domain-containing protein [Streptosporangium sp. NBC_01495]|uniref:condensation domain-containing protein n=1 Tax=Streptosporangium sp. NBC_01495 TaxID=2903899 RepID=UPI002E341B21|nr:condensation domain-containing protein [Streptosporangium sp. NBC_01495]
MSHGPFDLRGIPLALHLNGLVDVPALLGACADVADRHPVLGRVRVTRTESTPERYPGVATAEAARPFDLERGPLARFTLVTVGPERVRLLFTAHGRVFDADSKDVLVRDLADAYFSRATLPGPTSHSSPVPSPYGASPGSPSARTGRRDGAGADGGAFQAPPDGAEEFWKERDREPAELVLPGLRAVPRGTGPGEIVEMVLGGAESGALTGAATALGATRFELLLAAVGVLLRRYGTSASPLALDLGTRTCETRDRVGPFVARVPFVPHPELDEGFPGYLRTVRAELHAMYRFRHAPPEPPSSPVLLSYRRRTAVPEFPGLGAGVEWTVFNGAAHGALHIQAVDAGLSLTLGLRFNPAAIDHDDVSRIAGHLRALLRAISAEPRAKVADLAEPPHPTSPEESSVTDLFVPAPGNVTEPPVGEDPITTEVREIWQEILRLDDIGLDEDLYDLGGHSLTITQIIARTRRRLGVEVSLDVFFDNPTIAGLVEEVTRLRGEAA